MSKNKSRGNGLEGRDPESGRFLTGNNGGGRKPGSRNRLGEAFISDLHDSWVKHGRDVIDRVIRDEPAKFLKTVAALMPKETDQTLTLEVDLFRECQSFAQAFRLAQKVIGAEISRDDETMLIESLSNDLR